MALAITVASGLVYGVVQQDLRLTANDPQIQMAEDAADIVGTLVGGLIALVVHRDVER